MDTSPRAGALAASILVCACGPTGAAPAARCLDTPSARTEPLAPAPPAPEAEVVAPAPRQLPLETIASLTDDIDGDGKKDRITLTTRELIINGKASDLRKHIVMDDELNPGMYRTRLRIVDIDRHDKQKEVVVELKQDTFLFHVMFILRDGVVHRIWDFLDPHLDPDIDLVNGDEGRDITLTGLTGNGTIVHVTGNCGQTRTEVFKLSKQGHIVKHSETRIGQYDEDACSACPMVYTLADGEASLQGEILRNLRHPSLNARQSLLLRAPQLAPDGALEVELREEKPEITYLDDVYLTVGRRLIRPDQCSAAEPFCARDGRFAVLHTGDRRRLRFHVGSIPEGVPVTLWATGYYEPTR
jgi:hypothetical protein